MNRDFEDKTSPHAVVDKTSDMQPSLSAAPSEIAEIQSADTPASGFKDEKGSDEKGGNSSRHVSHGRTDGSAGGKNSTGIPSNKTYAGQDDVKRAGYIREHFAYIRDIIHKNLVYPAIARKLKWQGSVTVSFVICDDGRIKNIRVLKSSGYDVLDSNVVETISGVQPLPKPPVSAELIIPVVYRLH
ncbi:MAG: energy transducer TonB [Deltaproteobacteria bacterium]